MIGPEDDYVVSGVIVTASPSLQDFEEEPLGSIQWRRLRFRTSSANLKVPIDQALRYPAPSAVPSMTVVVNWTLRVSHEPKPAVAKISSRSRERKGSTKTLLSVA